MSMSEQQAGEMSADEYATDQSADGMSGMSATTTDIATGRKARTNRSKVTLSAIVTCPSCGTTNKPEWMYKSRHGDSFATTMWCEQCGSLITIWAKHVDAQIVSRSEAD